MQITKAEVTPVELKLRQPVRMAGVPEIEQVTAIFLQVELLNGKTAWGCTVAHPALTGDKPDEILRSCQEGASLLPSLHPTNLEYSLSELTQQVQLSPAALCAFDLAFHDLLGIATGLPLYRLLGGFRNRILTSATIPISPEAESVEAAHARASAGFRSLKVKGGLDPEEDVRRVRAIHTALPGLALRLDADGGYTVRQALDVARALEGTIEMFEQPTSASDPEGLREVTRNSPVPVLADQSASGPASVLELASHHTTDGVSVKIGACGGLQCARQVDAIARAARMMTMVGCLLEPALLTAAGLSFALSSPNVRFGDLDGYLDLESDPSTVTFRLEEGWLVASEEPGLGGSARIG